MKEIQPRRVLLANAAMIGILAFNTACDTNDSNSLPISIKETLSSSEQTRHLENAIHLNGSGFILIPDTNNFPEDNFVVEVLLKPDLPTKVLSQITERDEVLFEDNYTIFSQHSGTLEEFALSMATRENPDGSITYSYNTRLIDKKNPLDLAKNICPVKVGYGVEKKVSAKDFAKPKNITLEVRKGKPKVYENGGRIRMHVGRLYITPEGIETLKSEEYRKVPTKSFDYVSNMLIEVSCNIGNGGFGIGGSMLPDGKLLGHINATIYQASIHNIKEDPLKNTIAKWDFKNGSLIDLSGNGYNGIIVRNVSIE